jgi:hypothetical protein
MKVGTSRKNSAAGQNERLENEWTHDKTRRCRINAAFQGPGGTPHLCGRTGQSKKSVVRPAESRARIPSRQPGALSVIFEPCFGDIGNFARKSTNWWMLA